MTLYKTVNGVQIELTQLEEDAYNDSQPTEASLLMRAREKRCAYLEEQRHIYQYANIVYLSNEYKMSERGQRNFLEEVLNTAGDIDWILSDMVTTVTLTRIEAEALRDDILTRRSSAYTHWSAKTNDIISATTIEEIEGIDWTLI